jgi:hypothetical protein
MSDEITTADIELEALRSRLEKWERDALRFEWLQNHTADVLAEYTGLLGTPSITEVIDRQRNAKPKPKRKKNAP